MRNFSRKTLGSALVGAVLFGGLGVSLAGSASADDAERGVPTADTKIRAAIKGNKLDFFGPKSVEKGEALAVVNRTDPNEIGPHTFSLVRKRKLPTGNACPICNRIAEVHQVDDMGNVDRPDVDVRKTGWDKSFGKRGDSVVTEFENQFFQRKVKADRGTNLFFFCAVHPEMRKKVEVK